jgi:hypothetical protein
VCSSSFCVKTINAILVTLIMSQTQIDNLEKMSKQSLRGELKDELEKYFDDVQSKIKIHAQTLLLTLEDGSQKRKDVLKIKQAMLDKVKKIYDKNSKAVDDYFNSRDMVETSDLEELKAIILNGFCVYYNQVNYFMLVPKLFLGMLIVTDWFLDENQLKCLKYLLVEYLQYNFQFSINNENIF